MSNEILLSTLLSTDQKEFKIHNIVEVEGLVYFKINDHQFQTTGSWIYHKNHVMFDLAPTKIYAKKENTVEGAIESKIDSDEFNKNFEKWLKFRASLYRIVFLKGLQIYKDTKDDKKFLEAIEEHFFITEEGKGCQKLIKMLEIVENK